MSSDGKSPTERVADTQSVVETEAMGKQQKSPSSFRKTTPRVDSPSGEGVSTTALEKNPRLKKKSSARVDEPSYEPVP